MSLQERIVQMDKLLFAEIAPPAAANAISSQIDLLANAFGARR